MNQPLRGRYVYPLSSLFLLSAACCVIATLLTPVARATGVGSSQAVAASLGAALYAASLGGIIGLYHHQRRRGFLWGLIVGGAIGGALGPVALAPSDAFWSLIAMSILGAALLVAIAAGFRLLKPRT